jgi:hypothetical protein
LGLFRMKAGTKPRVRDTTRSNARASVKVRFRSGCRYWARSRARVIVKTRFMNKYRIRFSTRVRITVSFRFRV